MSLLKGNLATHFSCLGDALQYFHTCVAIYQHFTLLTTLCKMLGSLLFPFPLLERFLCPAIPFFCPVFSFINLVQVDFKTRGFIPHSKYQSNFKF